MKENCTRTRNSAHFIYNVRIETETQVVCKKAFISLYGITDKRVKRLTKLMQLKISLRRICEGNMVHGIPYRRRRSRK